MPDGDFYDRCNRCDTEAEASHRSEGVGETGASHHEWSVYSCDPRAGGCGNAWSKTTRQGLEKREAQGAPTQGLTASAETQRAMSLPSERYKANYSRIRWDR